ncbi:GGDEF domain-containing protein [Pseudomonas fluorescens]|uniref:diguanylate cyclase n=1 Tax=Pseudomonas fluorescens TaxID=294 RepID=A0AAE2PZI1_PSEFL|nr:MULTISPECIES: GGDEF domain-containing protein [Pseudomonas fluorescens group]MBA1431554.1 GGDEF domain-containing protein [Pseudomonas orientalis]MBD8150999.1 GGDEF domain-containing protein [Pseudomonas fluorescens]MBD8179609.1 GGDEF domain-containing protein [Pseudomonas fluorescens]MBD8270829.1 GGDEF domain-containing protein [Pseudomonas fluorescens]MBD8748145.1 GGDEF domain-containing protein [Pseudomonas fluorescens]
MPAHLKLRPRMRRLLSPAVTQAEWIGIIAWTGIGWMQATLFDMSMLSITLGLLLVCRVHSLTTNFLLWRLLGVAYIVLLSVGFAYVIHLNPQLRIYGLPLAVILVVGSAILFISVQDYLVGALSVWLILWSPMQAGLYAATQSYLLIFCASSVSIGFILSYSYLKNLRSVLLVESEFRALAETDYLTSILNRRAFMQSFERLLDSGQGGYFIMLDIDSFKAMNDRYGHDVGDKILRAMALCLKNAKGSYSFGRIGGEEFGVLLQGDDPALACEFVLDLLQAIRCSVAAPHNYTCSAGMARFASGDELSAVLKIADKNLYGAKRNGKDCVHLDGAPLRPVAA